MFLKMFLVKFITIYQLLWSTTCGYIIQFKETDSNVNLSVAINFIIESANATVIRVIGYDAFFENDFQFVTQHWRGKVSFELININRKHVIDKKRMQKNVLFLIFANEIVYSSLLQFMQDNGNKIRKNKIIFIEKSREFADKG